jgi:CRISPR-associated protein Cmr3
MGAESRERGKAVKITAFRLTALDALMFRDGRPFNQGDEGSDAAVSRFLPPPPTIAGALRLMFANALGYKSQEDWKAGVLGDGVNWQDDKACQLGPLSFSAALLSDTDGKLLYPCPQHLAKAEGHPVIALLPGKPLDCDLGKAVRLPAAKPCMKDVETYAGNWLTHEGMANLLAGTLPEKEQIIAQDKLYAFESRVGIGRDSDTRKARDGALYTASFVRMADGVSLVQPVSGLDPTLAKAQGLQRFGGEHRSAFIEPFKNAFSLPDAPKSLTGTGGKFRYIAIALAPVVLDKVLEPGGPVPGLEGHLVSACFGKPHMLGGWDSQNKTPLPMRPVLPAGSVFFMEADDEAKALARHGEFIGSFGAWGFGQVLIASGDWQ